MRKNKKTPVQAFFYFFVDINNAKNHPMIDQPKSHEPHRVRMASYFARPLTAARYAGVNIMHIKTVIAMTRFAIHKKLAKDIIVYMPYFAELPNSSSMRIN